MVAFRKVFPVLAVFVLMLCAKTMSAQALSCNVTAGVPPIVRAEGLTELTGDIVITCTGGRTVAPFLANFQIFLNTNITSRLQASDVSEALLMVDEPGTASNPNFCVSPGAGSNFANNGGITNGIGTLPTQPGGTVPAAPCGTFTPLSDTFSTQTGTYNVFRGQRATDISGSRQNALVWTNIPVVPPGTGTRTFRITNVRANASMVGPGGLGLPGQIVAFISVSGSQALPLNNPQQIVGYVQPGLAFDIRNCANTDGVSVAIDGSPTNVSIDQCGTSSTSGLRALAGNPLANETVPSLASFRFREGFQSAFKTRIATEQSNGTAQPGQNFNTESGFVRTQNGTNGVSLGNAGVADFGTRLAVRFTNVPANARIFVAQRNGYTPPAGTTTTTVDPVTGVVTTNTTPGTTPAARAVFVTTDPNGFGSGFLTPPAGGSGPQLSCGSAAQGTLRGTLPAVEVPLVNGSGVAVWEIVDPGNSAALAGVNEELYFPYTVAYTFASGATQVGLGTGTVIGNFAPFYTAEDPYGRMGQANLPIPRFIASTATGVNAVRVAACRTNLLFPYVTNWAGFDTGIAIANTSDDTGVATLTDAGTRRQAGRCRLNYFGKLPNGNAPTTLTEQTDRDVAAGETVTMVLSTGGGLGLRGNANFQGYIIAQCDFRYAHGFAFITDGPIGQARVAEGYLALVLDGANSLRGEASGEVRGH